MSQRAKEFTNHNVDHNAIPSKKIKTRYKPSSLFIPALFGGILILIFWLKKC